MGNNIDNLTMKEIAQLYREKSLSPVEVVKHQLEKIKEKEDLNAFITVTGELATELAKESEQRFAKGQSLGPMDGIPYGAKDVIYTKGIRTTMGSKIYKDYYPTINATVIDKLDGGGAILLGKTNTQEFAAGATSDVSYFGPVKNPYNKNKVSGGSSGGSAAAVAARIITAALGTDTSGSVRIPASACGIVGMKATRGRVSKYGAYTLSDTIDHIGPMTRNVEDNAIMLGALAGYDSRDPWSIKLPSMDFTAEIGETIKGMVIGVPYSLFEDITEPEIYDSIMNTIEVLKELGVKIKTIPSIDEDGTFIDSCRIVRVSEGYAVHRKNLLERPEQYSPELVEQISLGEAFKAHEYINAYKLRSKFQDHFRELMEGIDAIITPTLPLLPTDIGQREVEIRGVVHSIHTRYNLFTIIASYTGFPAITIPSGLSSDNLPIGLQILTDEYAETKAYRIAYQIEKALGLNL